MTGLCVCGFPLAAHRDEHNRSLSCEEVRLQPRLHVTVNGRLFTLRTFADCYRIVALAKHAA